MWETAYKAIENVDYAMAAAEERVFIQEFNALRIELFGLAWVHRFEGDEEYVIREVQFTHRYLYEIKRSEIWDAMAGYNQTVLASADKVRPLTEERKAAVARLTATGMDVSLAERAVNRVGTEDAWGDGTVVQELAGTFQRRLEIQLRPKGAAKLHEIVSQLYDEAFDTIKGQKVLVTWED